MPSLMNQLGCTRDAQLKTRMFGYLAQALFSAAFHVCMLDSA